MSEGNRAKLQALKILWQARDITGALAKLGELKGASNVSPYLLALEASLIQLQDDENGRHLSDAEQCLLEAHAIDPKDLGVLCDLSHFYDAVMGDAVNAARFAKEFLKVRDRLSEGIEEIANAG